MLRRPGTSALIAALCALGLFLGACDLVERPRGQDSGAVAATSDDWDRSVNSWIEAALEARPQRAVMNGRHEYDGRLADYSEQGLQRWAEVLKAARQQALAFERADLSREQEFERSNLLTRIDRELFLLDTPALGSQNAFYYLDGLDPVVYTAREYAPAGERLRAYVRYAENVPLAAEQISANLSGPLARVQLEVAARTFAALSGFLARDVAHTFSGVGERELQIAFARVNEAARAALVGLSGDLASRIPSAPEDGFALGRDALAEMLWKTERLAVSLGELEAVAQQELEWAMAELRKACESLTSGASIGDCVRELRSPNAGWSVLLATRRQVDELGRRLRQSGLVTMPPGLAILAREGLPHREYETVLLEPPGLFETGLDPVIRVAEPVASGDPEAVAFPSEADLWLLSAAEALPGKLALYLHARGSATEVSRLFPSRGSLDGWAHYAQQLAFEEGMLPDTPATEVAYLLSVVLHAVRLLAVVGLHAEGSTLIEAEELFRSRALVSDERARAEATLAAVDPGRLLGIVGRLLILRLREDWLFEQGESASRADFHDRLLSFGGAPTMMVRRAMVGDTGGSPL